MVTLVQLEYLVAVDTHRHFATAAEKCFVTQPTLSMQLKKLEEDLGITVFDRTKQPVIPTDAGKEIIEQARLVLREAKKVEEIVLKHKNILSGEVKIGIIPSLAPYLLPLFLGRMAKHYPLLQIQVQEMLTEDLINALHKDQLDIGLLVTPLNESGIIEEPIFYEKILAFFHKEHPLVKKKMLDLKDISRPEIWLPSQGHCFRNQVANLCNLVNIEETSLPFHFESGSLETIKKLVEIEGGFTLLPELATHEIAVSKRNQIKEFNDPVPIREVSLVYARNYAKKRVIEVMKKEITEALPSHMIKGNKGKIVSWK